MSNKNNKNNKKKNNQSNNSIPYEEKNDSMDFATFNRLVGGNGFDAFPSWMNEVLKRLDGVPQKYKRDQLVDWVANPSNYEKQLRALNQYLLNSSQFYKRMVYYFGTMLTFDYYLVPTNASEEDMKSDSFKKCYKKSLNWLEKFNVKDEFTKNMKIIMGEDIVFLYKRENGNSITLQRLPSDYCKLVGRTEVGFQYAFNMMIFSNPSMNIKNYPPEFEEYYNAIKDGKSGSEPYWQILDVKKAVAFKWDETVATLTPPLLGTFIDVLEISEFKELIKSKAMFDNWKLLFQRIPMGKDGKKNDFLIDLDSTSKFHNNVKKNLPDGVSVVTTPMEVTAINFDKSQSKDNIVGYSESAFYKSSGVSQLLFNSEQGGSIGLSSSIDTDYKFISHMYPQFERWVNYQLSLMSGKFKFKIVFLDVNYYNKDKKLTNYIQAGTLGFPKSLIGACLGLTPNDLINLSNFENEIDLINKMKPLMSSHTQSLDGGGRPQSDVSDLSDSGVKTKDSNANDNRAK